MLRTSQLWACTILACAVFCATAAQAATKYSAIYVFGDSYCDVGNIFVATSGAIPASPPYFEGEFSNGPIWIEQVAYALSLPVLPALAGGTDYAFGGAYATAPQVTPEGTIPDVPQQVELYLEQHGGKADPSALYILEGGGNDILGALANGGGSPGKLGLKIATALSESELILRRAGAKNFLVPNLFNVGFLPAAASNRKFAEDATVATNASLDALLGVESLLEKIKIKRIDDYSLVQSIEAHPNKFGFTNITAPCLNSVTDKACGTPNSYFFWDVEHPTAFAYTYFAEAALSAIDK